MQIKVKDIPKIVAIESECFGQFGWNEQMLLDELNNTYSHIIAYNTSNDSIVGYACIHLLDSAEVVNIAVLKDFRGQGIASSLLDEAEQLALAEGIDNMILDVSQHNDEAISLYNKHNYVISGKRNNFYEEGRYLTRHAYTMTKQLY